MALNVHIAQLISLDFLIVKVKRLFNFLDEHFWIQYDLACNCNIHGAILSSCDSNGACQCIENAIGDKCEYCKEAGYFPVPDCKISKIWFDF